MSAHLGSVQAHQAPQLSTSAASLMLPASRTTGIFLHTTGSSTSGRSCGRQALRGCAQPAGLVLLGRQPLAVLLCLCACMILWQSILVMVWVCCW